MRSILLSLLPFALLAAAPAMAQQSPVQKIYECAGLPIPRDRLACFDNAVAGLKQAEAKGDVSITTRQQARDAERQAFGLAAPPKPAPATTAREASAARPPAEESADTITVAVTAITKAPGGELVLTTDSGQVWRQSEPRDLGPLGKGPWKAEIRKAALGSFMLKLDGRTAIRVKRVK